MPHSMTTTAFTPDRRRLVPISAALLLFLTGCVGIPAGVTPVDGFQLDRYLGQWYEIARLDHSFERGLTRVTATYSLRSDGGVKVLNRGFSEKEKAWKEAEGKAYFVDSADRGYLKVSFFGPFYGSYVVFDLDHENYQYALVCGPNKSYLWMLARSPEVPDSLKESLTVKAAALGFDTGKLIFVDQRSP
jgi:apolipoprotein D and lipocalin family protein